MQEVPVNVFWDIENCAVPTTMKGVQVVNAIRSFALQRGILKNISAFANLKLIKDDLRADLQESGVLLHDVTRKANSSDLAILVEILKLVIDNKPPHCIVLISGDRDFANVLSTLTFRKYQVYLIHSLQASEVLKNAATEAFEWSQLLKRGGDTSIPGMPSQQQQQQQQQQQGASMNPFSPVGSSSYALPAPYDKFQPLLEFLAQKGKPQVEFSELGNLIPFTKYGYPKLKDYIFDAQSAGLVKCGANKNIHWVALAHANGHSTPNMQMNSNGPPSASLVPTTSTTAITRTLSLGDGLAITPPYNSLAARTPPTDRKQVVKHLLAALESLKKDYFKPTESTLQKRVKQMNLPLQKLDWEEIINIAKSHFFIVEGEKPNRTIFPPAGPFDGVDPSHPNADKFPPTIWRTLAQFFLSVHPVVRVGRYGFAVYLKEEGPPEVREMPLGSITELVQLALHKQLLKYHKTQVSTILPEENNNGDGSSPRQEGFNLAHGGGNLPPGYYNGLPADELHLLSPPTTTTSTTNEYIPSYDPLDGADETIPGEDERARLVGVTFAWPYPGTSVLVTGSFFNWRNTIALHRRERDYSNSSSSSTSSSNPPLTPTSSTTPSQISTQSVPPRENNFYFGVTGALCEPEDVFSTVLYLPPGKYEYKFIVDGAWHYDPRQPVVTDEVGNLNNIVVIEPSTALVNTEPLLDDYAYSR